MELEPQPLPQKARVEEKRISPVVTTTAENKKGASTAELLGLLSYEEHVKQTIKDTPSEGGVPIFVMLPLNTVSSDGVLQNPALLEQAFVVSPHNVLPLLCQPRLLSHIYASDVTIQVKLRACSIFSCGRHCSQANYSFCVRRHPRALTLLTISGHLFDNKHVLQELIGRLYPPMSQKSAH